MSRRKFFLGILSLYLRPRGERIKRGYFIMKKGIHLMDYLTEKRTANFSAVLYEKKKF